MSDTAADTLDDAPVADVDEPQGGTGSAQDGGSDEPTSITPDEARKLRAELRNVRKEAAEYRTKLKEREDADLTDRQKLERDLTTERAAREQAETLARNLHVQIEAVKLGVRADAVDLVVSAIDWTSIEDASDAKQVAKAIRDVVKDRPYLSSRPEGLQGGSGRGTGRQGASDMNSIIRAAAGRS